MQDLRHGVFVAAYPRRSIRSLFYHMLAIKDPSLVPPGGSFFYKHTISGAEFRHHTVPHLFELVRKHCEANYEYFKANGFEFSNKEFTENICANAHPGVCHEVDDSGFPTIVERVVTAAQAVVRHARHGFKGTEQEMYETRRAICGGCVYFGGDSGGTWSAIACKKCGCTSLKLKWANETCPLGLW